MVKNRKYENVFKVSKTHYRISDQALKGGITMQRLRGQASAALIAVLLAAVSIAASFSAALTAEAAEYTVENSGYAYEGSTRVGRFSVNGKVAFCCDHEKFTPPTGTKASASVGNSEDVAKVLYYGYGGPEQWSGFADSSSALVATSLALDHYFNNGSGDGSASYSAFMKFLSTKDASMSGSSYIIYKTGKASYQRLIARIPDIKVSVSVAKESAKKTFTDGNACYSLAGAQYGIYAGGRLLTTVTTDKDGKASAEITLNREVAGKIMIKELKPSEGYVLDEKEYVCDGSSGKISITSKEPPVKNPVSLLLYKYDAETKKTADAEDGRIYIPQKGGSLAGAVFKVDFFGIKHDEMPQDKDYSSLKPLRTWYFSSDKDGRIAWEKSFLASGYDQSELFTDPDDGKTPTLPLGVVVIKEVKAPEGYIVNDEVYVSEIRAEGASAETDAYQISEIPENIKRGDLKFCKIEEGSNHRMAGIPFMITSLQEDGSDAEDGESHILVTDENGYASTSSKDNAHSYRSNANDDAWDGSSIDDDALDAAAGIWFGEKTALNDECGALPYGRYRIDELPCRNNEGYKLLKGIEIKVSKNSSLIELGTLTNRKVKLKTSVWDSELNEERVTLPRKDVTLTDRVEYKGLEKGEKYTLEGVLMDKSTGKELLVNGRKVTSTKEFTAETENGKIDMEFTFDASALKGCRIVVFETLVKGGLVIARHEDIDDTDQTIEFLNPEIGTEAVNGDTGEKYIEAGKKAVIKDRVHYSGLIRGYTYEIKGTLIDKSTGKELLVNGEKVTAGKEFSPNKGEGYIEVEFTFDASSAANRELVVFEELEWSGQMIAEHKDINDEGQTVTVKREIESVVSTGDRIPAAMLPALTFMTASAVAASAVLYRKKHTHM